MSAPVWTDNVSVRAVAVLARNAVDRITWDLTAKVGAWIYLMVGRGGTTALTNGIDIIVGRTLNAGAIIVPNPTYIFRGDATAAVGTTCTAAGNPNPAGSLSLTVASTASFAAGDLVCIQDDAATPTTLTEWVRVSRVTSATVLLLTSPTQQAHNNTGHTVRNHSDAVQWWLPGGALYEVVFDYGAQAAGESVTIFAKGQTFDSVS